VVSKIDALNHISFDLGDRRSKPLPVADWEETQK
jgi:hypothetical protein